MSQTEAIMFDSYKVVFAKNRVMIELIGMGLLTKTAGNLMRDIAGNPANKDYARSALKLGVVKCKYTAAAAIFARLAVLYSKDPWNGLTDREWKIACVHALVLAGAKGNEAQVVMDELLQMNQRIESQPLL